MTDEKLEQIKQFFDTFKDLDEFTEKYIKVNNPGNAEALIALFKEAKSKSDVWELSKIQRSVETLRLDKSMSGNATVEEIIENAKKYDLSKYKRIMIKLDNKNYEDIDKLSELGPDIVINVTNDKGICTLDEFKRMREFFNSFNERYSSYNLSNLEKITLAYDYVKFFTYNEELERVTESRSIAKSISSGSIVCEGYSRIFCQLLNEMGLASNLVFIEPNEKEAGGHVRVIVKVDDEKYGISDTFAFDPTWDSNQNMSIVSHPDETTSYETEACIKPEDTVIENLPSDIRYLFFMIPIDEYSKYFNNEKIERIEKYPTRESIELTDELMTVLNYNDKNPKDDFVNNFMPDLLYNTKIVEGYTKEQIEKFINNASELLKQDRYGRFDKNRAQDTDAKSL